jgi:SAM-dependent methyltransferase
MSNGSAVLSSEEAERFRSFERQRHNSLAITYHDFFTPVTMLAIRPLLQAVQISPGSLLLDVATGPGSVASEATKVGARSIGVDLSPGMIALAKKTHPGIDFRMAEVEHLPFSDQWFDAVVCNFWLRTLPVSRSISRRMCPHVEARRSHSLVVVGQLQQTADSRSLSGGDSRNWSRAAARCAEGLFSP